MPPIRGQPARPRVSLLAQTLSISIECLVSVVGCLFHKDCRRTSRDPAGSPHVLADAVVGGTVSVAATTDSPRAPAQPRYVPEVRHAPNIDIDDLVARRSGADRLRAKREASILRRAGLERRATHRRWIPRAPAAVGPRTERRGRVAETHHRRIASAAHGGWQPPEPDVCPRAWRCAAAARVDPDRHLGVCRVPARHRSVVSAGVDAELAGDVAISRCDP